ncbi:[protein-PII] uridylyltransferase [Granulosicoccus antarcticus]|uniref:Bifunctional uridylyltransferase/uridylyl-removing enzyme n=1 Tax=Granulosicoccus antarcticus IMCC3135 TaxID=1192854 RepID=A0A2Z2P1N0_9GAMM|nr:[protein-PII] uridylyltransferase [Granulosicoccus antarcticus]ASJ75170.1 Bifunctional uridylyltransferase/uridylyl-removing enzyme [Granulosicoccus antarcticus IMCC3135]
MTTLPGSPAPRPAQWEQIDFPTVRDQIIRAIQELINSSEHSTDLYRKAIQLGGDAIHEQFLKGAQASCLLELRTAVIDYILRHLWGRQADAFDGLALVAVGGYGRGELHPHSDIDIAILLPSQQSDEDTGARNAILSDWITALWDLNLDIGHSVRTVADCEREAGSDITVITNLMEARLLCGCNDLFKEMQEIIQPSHMWTSAEFFAAKVAEQEERHKRFQTNAYRLEPNIKESQGGLRDFQTIAWVCQRQFGTAGLNALVTRGLLEPQELVRLREGLELLWRIRYLLHHVSKRREDRLLFDYQKDIAHAFGYLDDTENRSIEQLMQRFYRSVMSLLRLNEILLQGIGGIISGVTAASEIIPINSRFQLRNGFLEVTGDDVFMHYPPALLELFLVFGNTPEALNVRSNTVRLIRANLPLINDRFRSDPVVRNLFVQIFSNPHKLTRTVRLMNRYGVMAAYLPAFDKIVGRMQYDLFHIYTVDEHTLGVIRNLRRMMLPQFADEMPHGSSVAKLIKKPYILYLTALFHDIAKGRGGDHSVLGAEDVKVFAATHGLPQEDAELMEWTVRNHLLMSMTAQRKDIDDPNEQLEFARQCGSIERLNHLYLLTISDIRATNPELWNSFKQSLLQSLHRHAMLILKRGLDNPLDVEDVINRRQEHTRTLLDDSLENDPRVDMLWATLGDDYFRQYQAVEIARHTEILLANEDTPGPLVSLRYSASRGSTEILIYTPDDKALFALITAVMERLQLNILSATINTTAGGFALDTFHVLDATQMPIEDISRIDEVRQTLTYELGVPRNLPRLDVQYPSRRLRYFSVSTQVECSNDESGFTEVHITAADRPGILSGIGRVLMGANFNVHAARIATLGERIDDVFLLSNEHGNSLTAAEQQTVSELLQQEL